MFSKISHDHDIEAKKERAVGEEKRLKQKLAVMVGSTGLFIASNAYAIGPIEVGDWELKFGSNINAFYSLTFCS